MTLTVKLPDSWVAKTSSKKYQLVLLPEFPQYKLVSLLGENFYSFDSSDSGVGELLLGISPLEVGKWLPGAPAPGVGKGTPPGVPAAGMVAKNDVSAGVKGWYKNTGPGLKVLI